MMIIIIITVVLIATRVNTLVATMKASLETIRMKAMLRRKTSVNVGAVDEDHDHDGGSSY